MTSASCKAPLAAVSMALLSLEGASWIPGISTKRIWAPGRVLTPVILLQVVCGLGETMAIFSPTRRFRRVDLPTLGRPMMGTTPERNSLCWLFTLLFFFLLDSMADEPLTSSRTLGDDLLALTGHETEHSLDDLRGKVNRIGALPRGV